MLTETVNFTKMFRVTECQNCTVKFTDNQKQCSCSHSVCFLLQKENPWLLQHFIPATVGKDGNCLFQAVALAL